MIRSLFMIILLLAAGSYNVDAASIRMSQMYSDGMVLQRDIPLVIKGEYYFGVKCWWVFLLSGIVSVATSICVADILWSTLLAVFGASSFWSIGELFEQRKRVERGWFPKREKKNKRG